MDRSNDPAHVRVGVCVGSADDAAASARLLVTFHEVMSRMLNLVRLAIVALPILIQCFYIHSVDFVSWLLRLVTLYVLIGGACFLLVPEQLYNGMGLASLRWIFEKFYPDIALANGSIADTAEKTQEGRLSGHRISELHGQRTKIRWHGTNRYLCITTEGWAVTGEENYAATLYLQRVFAKDKQVPDTYNFRICEPDAHWSQAWLAFRPIDHLRFGGWLGAYRDPQRSCPYKILQDSSCPVGTFKLLCAWTERLYGEHLYVGHASDRDAALLELVFV
mmetsp:Transcript_34294/g.90522  ORF Transcript_34294/g.90522 Transcript_34294/m.90522 type:complete len:277 (+) Transcript_34294:2-832(+)